jgi:hypothetical protein
MMGINTLGRNTERENTQIKKTKKTTAAHHLGDFVNHYIENQQSTKINQISHNLSITIDKISF